MKKLCFILIYSTIPFCISAQTIQIGVGAGSTIVTDRDFYIKELSGIFSQEILGKEYTVHLLNELDFNSEYNLNLKARLFFEELPFTFYSEVSYNSLVGKGTMIISPHPASSYLPPPQNVESSCHLFNTNLGIEYELMSKAIIPVLSSSIVLSYLGDTEIKSVENDDYESTVFNGGIRLGLDFGIGLYYKIYSPVLVGVSSKYSFNNLLGKKDSEENLNTIKISINVFYEL